MIKNLLKKSGWVDIVTALLFIIFGILLVISPQTIMSVVTIILGSIFIVIGILRFIEYYSLKGTKDTYLLATAVCSVIIGIIIMFCASIIFSAFTILIGIWILYSGIKNLTTAIMYKDYKSSLWLISLIVSIIMTIAGVYVLVNNNSIMQFIGIVIISFGVLDIIENAIFIKKIENYLE